MPHLMYYSPTSAFDSNTVLRTRRKDINRVGTKSDGSCFCSQFQEEGANSNWSNARRYLLQSSQTKVKQDRGEFIVNVPFQEFAGYEVKVSEEVLGLQTWLKQ